MTRMREGPLTCSRAMSAAKEAQRVVPERLMTRPVERFQLAQKLVNGRADFRR